MWKNIKIYYHVENMGKEIIGFGNTENEKHKFHGYKNAIF